MLAGTFLRGLMKRFLALEYTPNTVTERMQVDDIRQMVYEDFPENEETESPGTTSTLEDDHQGYVFGYASSAIDLRDLHPLPSQLPFFLKMYALKVDPCIKILHMPSMEKLIEEAQHNLDGLSRSKEALLFSVYFAVIIR